jgi:hypothetical protein
MALQSPLIVPNGISAFPSNGDMYNFPSGLPVVVPKGIGAFPSNGDMYNFPSGSPVVVPKGIGAFPSNGDMYNFPSGSPVVVPKGISAYPSNGDMYNFPAELTQQALPNSMPSSGDLYNFPAGSISKSTSAASVNFQPVAIQNRTSSMASVASSVSTGACYNFPPGSINRAMASRPSMASIAEKAESTGTQDDFVDEDFGDAVECWESPREGTREGVTSPAL